MLISAYPTKRVAASIKHVLKEHGFVPPQGN